MYALLVIILFVDVHVTFLVFLLWQFCLAKWVALSRVLFTWPCMIVFISVLQLRLACSVFIDFMERGIYFKAEMKTLQTATAGHFYAGDAMWWRTVWKLNRLACKNIVRAQKLNIVYSFEPLIEAQRKMLIISASRNYSKLVCRRKLKHSLLLLVYSRPIRNNLTSYGFLGTLLVLTLNKCVVCRSTRSVFYLFIPLICFYIGQASRIKITVTVTSCTLLLWVSNIQIISEY